ncbi:MAG: T9SS type A sorting domain-containing protein [candidate division WOR-3 bacterium]
MRFCLLIGLVVMLTPGAEVLRITSAGLVSQTPGMSMVEKVEVDLLVPDSDSLPVMPGWPKRVPCSGNFAPNRGVALADLDDDGSLEVIMPSTANQLHVWRHDGSYYPGWPRSMSGMGQYAAAVADVDRDGEFEIAVCTRGMTSGGAVYLFSENGTVKPGWPFTGLVNGNFSDSPTLADLDGDDTLEIIVGERDWPVGHLHVLRHNGTEFPGLWPCSLDHVPAMGAAVGDINLDGQKEIVYASYNSLYVFHPDGTILPGWPQTNPGGGYFSYQSPALADVDQDDTLEIVVAEHRDGQGTYVFRHDGTIQTGWPYPFSRWTYCPPTVADLFRNQDKKILCGLSGIVGGAAYVLYAFDDDGSVLPGFPILQPSGDAAEGNITVADIDGDGDMEVIFTSNLMTTADTLGYLYAVHHDGTPVSGWPLRPHGWTYLNGATVADVDGDDSLDIVSVSADNSSNMVVTIWEAGVPFNRLSWEWPTYQFDMERTGLYQAPSVGIADGERARVHGHRLTVLPNPARAGAWVRLETLDSGPSGFVSLFNLAGARVASLGSEQGQVRLPDDLQAGVYLVSAGKGEFTKLLVQK